jgi:hypothetical protein
MHRSVLVLSTHIFVIDQHCTFAGGTMPDLSAMLGGMGAGAGGMPDLSAMLGGMGAGAGGMPDLSALLGGMGAGAGGMPDLSAMLGGMGVGAGFGGMVPPVADPETTYAAQLVQLQDMGFGDRPSNIRALQATSGNVNAAVERLLAGFV